MTEQILKPCPFVFGVNLSLQDHKELRKRANKNFKHCMKVGSDMKYWWFNLIYLHDRTINTWNRRV
ncbi:hypothetical protein LCGC14_0667180 [marine sediment metagenome]|uniref:Uncharacterized protein n=1 Tax=marine sediment metagenome TaxID=412755 RepID=A0A0F9TDF3_9ZZZZ